MMKFSQQPVVASSSSALTSSATTTTSSGGFIPSSRTKEERIRTLVEKLAPEEFTSDGEENEDSVSYLCSILIDYVQQQVAGETGSTRGSTSDHNGIDELAETIEQFFGDEHADKSRDLATRLVEEEILAAITSSSTSENQDDSLAERFQTATSLGEGRQRVVDEESNTEGNSHEQDGEGYSLNDHHHVSSASSEEDHIPSPTASSSKNKSSASKDDRKKARMEARANRKKSRGKGRNNKNVQFSEDTTGGRRNNDEDDRTDAERISAQSAKELEELDDHASAWADCVESGRAWGGRGHGGRGLRSVHTNSTDVRSVHLSNVSLQFGGNDLLQNATIQITEGKRYGLLGRNGVGKSTLLKRLARKAVPGFPLHLRVLLVQQQVEGSSRTAVDTLLDADDVRKELVDEQERLEEMIELSSSSTSSISAEEVTKAVERLNEVLEELDAIGADTAEERARDILKGLQFRKSMQDSPTEHLSGGWKMRLALAQALYVPSDLLLLDEPSNHLDMHAVLWLANYLVKSDKTVVVVSHDRAFLDQVCTDIIHFDHQKLKYHPGNYSDFERQESDKAARQAQILDASERKRAKAEAFIQKQLQSSGGKKGHDPNKQRQAKMMKEKKLERIGNYREDGKRYKNRSLKTLSEDSMRVAEKVVIEHDDGPALKFRFPEPTWSPGMKSDGSLIRLEDVQFGYGPPQSQQPPLLHDMTLSLTPSSKIAVVGRNGAGKSTLLKILTGETDALVRSKTGEAHMRGTVWKHPNLRIGHVTQHHVEALDEFAKQTVVEYAGDRLRADETSASLAGTVGSIRQYLGAFGLGGKHANRLLGSLSGGERMRLCFATVFATQPHLLVLDEPTNHLDLETLDALSQGLDAFKGAIIIVSHNQRFLCGFCNELWIVGNGVVDVRHSDMKSFEENFAIYRSDVTQGVQGRSTTRQTRAAMAKQATKQRAGATRSGGFIGS